MELVNLRSPLPFLLQVLAALILAMATSLHSSPPAATSPQDPGDQAPVTVKESVLLSTKTPLGDAVVRIPAGTQVSIVETKEDWVLAKKPPFSAWIRINQTSLAPARTESPSPSPTASPVSSSTPKPAPSAIPLADGRDVRFRLPEWIPSSLIIPGFPWHLLFLAYGGFATVLLLILLGLFLRLKGTDSGAIKLPQPVVSLEAKTPPLPGFVECPLCRAPMLTESLSPGENQCPTCSGKFDCE
jgi:hypothetical protein